MFRLSLNPMALGRSERKRNARDARLGLESLEARELKTTGVAAILGRATALAPALTAPNAVIRPVVIPTPPLLRHEPADLDLVALNVQDLGNNTFRLTATLR